MNAERSAIRTAWISITGNTALAIIKGITGYLGNSYALIADAIESTADVFSSALVLFGIKYAMRPADKNHPYGHGRAEPLVTFVVVGFLVASAVIIAFESIKNIKTPHALPKPYTLIILGGIIIIKEVFYRVVKKRSRETGSTSLEADAWHHRSDAITSLTAFAGISFALIMGPGYEAADDWAALFATVFIMYNSYLIFRPALGEIMDEQLNQKLLDKIRHHSAEVEGVIGTEKCYIRKAGMKYLADLHIIVAGNISVYQGHVIAHKVKDHLKNELPELANVLIHVEPHSEEQF